MLRSISGVQIWQKITEKPSKHNWRIGDWINDEIPLQATLRGNYYKARNISCYLIFDGKGYDAVMITILHNRRKQNSQRNKT